MALKTLHIVQGLSRTPLLFIPRYLANILATNPPAPGGPPGCEAYVSKQVRLLIVAVLLFWYMLAC